MIVASVCIATFRRPEGLETLLASLAAQTGAPEFEVIVVENDPDGTGEAVALSFADRLQLRVLREPIPGVAAVRNRAVVAASGQFLAFIDDDEWADPVWLATLHRMMAETGADAVFGPVGYSFDPQIPSHIRECGMFDPWPFADRSELPWWATRTGNAYVRRSALPDQSAPFNLDYGLTGGEDTHLFNTMLDRGSRLVWSSDAVVHSHLVAARGTPSHLLRNAARYGGTGAEIEWLELSPRRRAKFGWRAAREALRQAGSAARLWRQDRSASMRSLVRAAMSAGRAARLLGYRVKIYRRPSR